jgi:hypothetical protein
MNEGKFCEKLSGRTCMVVQEQCFRMAEKKPCEYVNYLSLLSKISVDTPPIARRARESMLTPFINGWKKHCQNPKSGVKRILASPVEIVIRSVLKSELSSLNVSVSDTGKTFNIWGASKIIADALAEKEGFPSSIFSFKTWIGSEQIRETFAYAYLAKTWLGQKHIRVYEIGVLHTNTEAKTIERLTAVCKPYLDGVFYLTTAPYIDDLIKELREEVYCESGATNE